MFVYVLFVSVFYVLPEDPNTLHTLTRPVWEGATKQECEEKLKVVAEGMKEAYPSETNFKMSCELRKKIEIQPTPQTKPPLTAPERIF
jgi:hypothetical protein